MVPTFRGRENVGHPSLGAARERKESTAGAEGGRATPGLRHIRRARPHALGGCILPLLRRPAWRAVEESNGCPSSLSNARFPNPPSSILDDVVLGAGVLGGVDAHILTVHTR